MVMCIKSKPRVNKLGNNSRCRSMFSVLLAHKRGRFFFDRRVNGSGLSAERKTGREAGGSLLCGPLYVRCFATCISGDG